MVAAVTQSHCFPRCLPAVFVAAVAAVALAPAGAAAAAGAAGYVPAQVRAAEALEAAGARPVFLAVDRGMPRGLSLDLPVAGTTSVERARTFLASYGALFHLDRPEVAVRPSRVLRPVDGVEIVRHAQTWRGLPVHGAHVDVFLVSPAPGALARVGYVAASLLDPVIVDADPPVVTAIDATPRMDGAAAELVAYGAAGCAASDGPDPRLEIVDPRLLGLDGAPRLAWHVARPRCAGDERLVDAITGELLLRNEFVRRDGGWGSWVEQFDFDLEDAHGGTMNDTGCFNPTTMDEWIGDVSGIVPEYLGDMEAEVAWAGGRHTYRTWHDVFGWHSFDGLNSQLELYVHSGLDNGGGLANCGIEFGDGFVSIDATAHEFGHMVIQAHSGYYMWMEPGALHEALSDVTAAVVDPYDWDMFEDRTDGTGPGRALDDPARFNCGSYGPCPDHMSGFLPVGPDQDWGGIHWNSGIVSHAFYLMTEAGSGPGWAVTPISRERMGYVASLVMRSISDMADFADARNIAVALASPPLDAVFGLNAADACAIRNGFRAVGIGYGDPDCDGVEEEALDGDFDGVSDLFDNCLYVKNFDQGDIDSDGLGDLCDVDSDNDGYPDSVDPCWMTTNDFADPDEDGIANCNDGDDDGDGVLEDGDASGSRWDATCASGQTVGCDDNCAGDANPDQYDGNANGFGDACDPDFDEDGLYDEDNCPFVPNADQADADGDALGDACDRCAEDADGATAYYVPPCVQPPDMPPVECPGPRPLQPDADGDGIPDACDTLARRTTGVRLDGRIASARRVLAAGSTATQVRIAVAGEGLAYAPLRLCDTLPGGCELEALRLLEVVLSGLDPLASAWVEDGSGVPLARVAPSSSGDGTRGLRFRAAADGDYRLAVAPPAGATGVLTFAATVRTVDAASPDPWRRPPLASAVEPALPPDADGDGLWDTIDRCRTAYEPRNRDGDGDRVGDACDACAATAPAARVDPAGCSIADRCPCLPLAGAADAWRNHGDYVSCVAQEGERFVALGLLSAAEKDAAVSAAAGTACGRR